MRVIEPPQDWQVYGFALTSIILGIIIGRHFLRKMEERRIRRDVDEIIKVLAQQARRRDNN